MKRFLSIASSVLIMCSFQGAYAQTDKGTFTLGGNVAAGIWKPQDTNVNSLRITPSAGFFIRKNTLIGIGIPLEFGETRYKLSGLSNNAPPISTTLIGLSLIARRYFLEGRVKPFIHLDGSYNWSRDHVDRLPQDLRPETRTGQTIRADAGLGVSYFVTQRFSLEATATLGIANVESAITNKTLAPFNRYLLLGIGGNWYLPSKSKR